MELDRHDHRTRWINGLIQQTLALVFPPRCAGCDRVDSDWCDRCAVEVARIPFELQITPLEPLAYAAASAPHTGKLRQAIHALKYENARNAAVPLGERLAECLRSLAWPVDVIVPVPLHPARLRERGYNQAQLLAEHAARAAGIPCRPHALRRLRSTQTQVGLTGTQRHVNVQEAFAADPTQVANQHVLLIDDVYTTGATLQACASAALNGGAHILYGLTVTVARY